METLNSIIGTIDDYIWYPMFVILIGVGIYLTIRTRAVQFRRFPEMFRILGEPSGRDEQGRK